MESDPPYLVLGYPALPNGYNPFTCPDHAPGEGAKYFPVWVSGYYKHGDQQDQYEFRIPQEEPKPTIFTMSEPDIHSALHPEPAAPGGTDDLLLNANTDLTGRVWDSLRRRALYITEPADNATAPVQKEWNDIELRHIWCEQSPWVCVYAIRCLKAEVAEVSKTGKTLRPITTAKFSGGNHFVSHVTFRRIAIY